MLTFIYSLIPEIIEYPFIALMLCSVFVCFFGGFIFSSIFNMITGFIGNDRFK